MSGFYDTLIKSYEYATYYKYLANPTSTIETYQKTVKCHASTQKKYKKCSHLLFENKTHSKGILHRTGYCNKYLKTKDSIQNNETIASQY